MKNKLLDQYVQAQWSQHKPDTIPPLNIRDAAIRQAHIERSLAFIQLKTEFSHWLKSMVRSDRTGCCDQPECST